MEIFQKMWYNVPKAGQWGGNTQGHTFMSKIARQQWGNAQGHTFMSKKAIQFKEVIKMVHTITVENFEEEVLKCEKPVLVDFWAAWCVPCQMQGPVVEQAAAKFPQVKFGKVNVDEEGELAQKYGVMSIPMLILFQNGQAAKKAVGFHSFEEMEKLLG